MGIESNIERLRAGLQRLPQELHKVLKPALAQCGNEFVNTMVKTRFRPYTGWSNTGDILQSRTSFLKKSIGKDVSGETVSNLELRVYSAGIKYANLQEYGGTIRPRNGKYLALPIGKALGPRGVPRRNGPRDYQDGFFFRSNGNLFFGRSVGKGKRAKVEALYSLRKQVTIPPRFGFRATWNNLAGARLLRLQKATRAGIRASFGGSI